MITSLNSSYKKNEGKDTLVIWEKRAILLTAFGVVGLGTLLGVVVAYVSYLKKKLEDHFRIDSAQAANYQSESKSPPNKRVWGIANFAGNCIRNKSRRRGRSKSTSDLKKSQASKAMTKTRSLQTILKSHAKLSPQDRTPEGERNGDSTVEFKEDLANYPLKDFLEKIDKLLAGSENDQHEAYLLLQNNTDKLAHLSEYWWRLAQATHLEGIVAGNEGDKEFQKTLVLDALEYAEKSLNLNDTSSEAHKWYAITLGCSGEYLKLNEKIQNGFTFKQHIDKALELNPNDPTLYYLLGRFCFEVSQLTWMERRVASALFAAPPTGTIQEALKHFHHAEKLGHPTIDNRFYLGKCYMNLGDNKKTAYWLREASTLPATTSSQRKTRVKVLDLYSKYEKYL